MSNDTNWMNKNYAAYDKRLEPLPELESDEAYIERRKAREEELWTLDVLIEAAEGNISKAFIASIQLARLATKDGFLEVANQHKLDAMNTLMEDVGAYIQELAKDDIDNE